MVSDQCYLLPSLPIFQTELSVELQHIRDITREEKILPSAESLITPVGPSEAHLGAEKETERLTLPTSALLVHQCESTDLVHRTHLETFVVAATDFKVLRLESLVLCV